MGKLLNSGFRQAFRLLTKESQMLNLLLFALVITMIVNDYFNSKRINSLKLQIEIQREANSYQQTQLFGVAEALVRNRKEISKLHIKLEQQEEIKDKLQRLENKVWSQ